jgi:PAS domain S-box-containing protein
MLFGILMLLLGFNMLPVYDCFADSPVPFSAGRGAAAWIALFISTMTIHDFVFKLYGKLLREKIQLQFETKERALSVEAQRESEKKYRTLLQTNNVGYVEMDISGNVTFCNDVIESFTGYTRDEMIGLNYAIIMSDEIAGKVFKTYRSVFKKEIAFGSVDHEIIRKDGIAGFFETTISLITDRAGNPDGFRVIGIDITKRKQIEDALRASEERYRLAMENISDSVFICKFDGHFKYINPAVTRLLGIPQDDLVGKHYLSIVLPEYRQQLMNFYQKQASENIETTYFEFPVLAKNGEILWAGQTVRMIRNYEGDIEFYGVVRDISTLKKAEEARRDLEDAKTRFFSNISHEIRTPLTLMLGPIESVLQGDYGREVDSEFFENLHRNTLRLLILINNLLDFSKIEAGRMTMKVLEGDIVSFARSYITSMETVGKTRGIEMRFDSSADSIMLYFDPERLDKVMMNLLSNAFKFTATGGEISVTVSGDDDHCRIIVADTGEGIPEKSINAIFERFCQADTASIGKNRGTGIGLALAKELVEIHGGSITAESRYIADCPDNHGSAFTITLPKGKTHFENRTNVEIVANTGLDAYVKDYRAIGIREMAELKNDDTVSAGCENTENIPFRGAEKSILVVDDNRDMRNFLKILLKGKYRVILAENGEEGIRCARRHRPNLIVTDVMMPVMSGFEMTAIIKKEEELKTTPVIMLTADTELINKVAGLEFGADDYLHKPFNSLELMTRISSLLKNYEYQQIISRRNRDIEGELDMARMLLERLLPGSMPEIPGYREYAVYSPMDKVGGDFYGIERRDDFIDIFIADVSGHGLSSAILATVAKIALENITTRTAPEKVLHLLNDVIHRHTVRCKFVTAFYAIIDINTGAMRYSSAGHVPPFLYRKKNDEFIELAAKGTPLGWFQNIRIEEKIIQLESGDRVVFYTDGITECSSPADELYDEIRFQITIREHAGKSAGDFSRELMKELEAYHGKNTYDDDVTMVVLDVV